MTKNDFLQRFQLLNLSKSTHIYQHPFDVKSAAVLIPIIENNNQLEVLFTKRATHLKHHPGQVSFPGGKVEPSDKNLIETALRETFEEIGISADSIQILGQLNSYHTISGYVVTPVIAFVDANQNYAIDENEVSEIFHVPLQHFLHEPNHHTVNLKHKGKNHPVHFMPYQGYNIWGATAAMLKDLVTHLN